MPQETPEKLFMTTGGLIVAKSQEEANCLSELAIEQDRKDYKAWKASQELKEEGV